VSILSTYDPEVAIRVRTEERVEAIIRNMLEKEYPVSSISDITHVSEKDILRIKDELDMA